MLINQSALTKLSQKLDEWKKKFRKRWKNVRNSNKFFMALKCFSAIIPSNERRAYSKPIPSHYNFLLRFYDPRRSFAYIMSIQFGG